MNYGKCTTQIIIKRYKQVTYCGYIVEMGQVKRPASQAIFCTTSCLEKQSFEMFELRHIKSNIGLIKEVIPDISDCILMWSETFSVASSLNEGSDVWPPCNRDEPIVPSMIVESKFELHHHQVWNSVPLIWVCSHYNLQKPLESL